jgi:UDP-2,3-diacylglucosamine pyrophosphatase LpxH
MPESAIADFQQNLFLMSDIHFDSIYCEDKLLTRDLDLAKKEGKWIIINGDWFDAMQGRKDPRGRLDELRPELKTEKYFDVLVDTTVQYLEPYQENILLFAYGNHEQA